MPVAIVSPMDQSIVYDAFSQMTKRSTIVWGQTGGGFERPLVNGRTVVDRVSGENITYDASGHMNHQGNDPESYQTTTFDAAGRRVNFDEKWRREDQCHTNAAY